MNMNMNMNMTVKIITEDDVADYYYHRVSLPITIPSLL